MPAAHWISGSTTTAAVSAWCPASQCSSDCAARSATSTADSPSQAPRASGLSTVAARRTSGAYASRKMAMSVTASAPTVSPW